MEEDELEENQKNKEDSHEQLEREVDYQNDQEDLKQDEHYQGYEAVIYQDDQEDDDILEARQQEKDNLGTIRALFTDVEVAEVLKEAARIDGLEDYDVWFKMIGEPDPRQRQG